MLDYETDFTAILRAHADLSGTYERTPREISNSNMADRSDASSDVASWSVIMPYLRHG